MTKDEIEQIVGKKLTYDTCSPANDPKKKDKTLYGKWVYFYKREILDDHYFYLPKQQKLYVIYKNPDNTNPSITETGNKADSFKMLFDEYLAEGKIEEISVEVFDRTNNGYIDNFGKGESYEMGEVIIPNPKDVIIQRIDKIIIELTDLKAELRK